MNQEIEARLDQCLSSVLAGERSPGSCSESYPDLRDELEPLLHLAAHSHALMAPEQPSPTFVKKSRLRLMARLRRDAVKQQKTPIPRLFLRIKPAYALATMLLVLALAASGFGVVSASAASLPGDTLYGIKLASEQVQLTVSLSSEGDAALLMKFAGERISEAEELAALGRYGDIDQAIAGLNSTLEAFDDLDMSSHDMKNLEHVESQLGHHLQVLERVLEKVPDSAQKGIENALERSSKAKEKINKAKTEHPRNGAPGQDKKDENSGENPGRGKGQDKVKPEKTKRP